MKFVLAPDKFKGSLTGLEFCNAVEKGLRMLFADQAEIIKMPLADGGDGTLATINHYLEGERIQVSVNDPFFRPITAEYLFSKTSKIAYIEMAEASGLKLLNSADHDCKHATSLGTGELIADALNRGAKEIILGIGGSASNDAGMGMAQALGYRFLDHSSQQLKSIGAHLVRVQYIDDSMIHPRLHKATIKVACDVSNPFFGPDGAAKIYAEQKGATVQDIEELDKGMRHFSNLIQDHYKINLQKIEGSGAAGGMGGGALVFLQAQLNSGIHLIKEIANFDKAIANADWIVTGEGKLDRQTLSGKTIAGILQSAHEKNVAVAALCGTVELSAVEQKSMGFKYVSAITDPKTNLQEAMNQSYTNLIKASFNFAKTLQS